MTLLKAKAVFNRAVDKWWIVYCIGLFLFGLWVVLIFFGPPIPRPTDEIMFYPWVMHKAKAGVVLNVAALVPLLAGCLLFSKHRKSLELPLVLVGVTLIGWVAGLAFIGPATGVIMLSSAEPDPTLTHVSSVRTYGHVYNLASHRAVAGATLGQAYVLYDCDITGIICRAIYRYKPSSLDAVYADTDHPPLLRLGKGTLELHIAGKMVYTVPVAAVSP
jgi:hypothetical protein